jgi:hypothetical protein
MMQIRRAQHRTRSKQSRWAAQAKQSTWAAQAKQHTQSRAQMSTSKAAAGLHGRDCEPGWHCRPPRGTPPPASTGRRRRTGCRRRIYKWFPLRPLDCMSRRYEKSTYLLSGALRLREWHAEKSVEAREGDRCAVTGWEGGKGPPTAEGRGEQNERALSVGGGWEADWREFFRLDP